MKNRVFITALVLLATWGQAQNKNYLSNRYSLERMGSMGSGSNPILPGLPMASPEVVGDPFSKPNFSLTSAILYSDQVINNIHSKLDLLTDEFYFKTSFGIRVMPGHQVKSFTFTDSLTKKNSTYINAKEFKSNTETTYTGFFEIIQDGEMALLKKTEASVKKANYHVALSVGSQDHKVNKSSTYYYLSGDVVKELPTGRTLTSIFGDQKAKVDRYIKINQLNLKDERHLMLVFEYNSQNL